VALGPDHTGVAAQFVEAMRPIAGDNVDLPPVQANLAALGLAVHRTLTADAETRSVAADDPAFWEWVKAMRTWVAATSAAFAAWTPTTPAETALKTALGLIPVPPAAPTALKGRIR
jgi:hypothetical protein